MSAQPQHMQALNLANEIRFERAAVRAWIKEPGDAIVSRHRLADLLTEAPLRTCLRTLLLEDFLMWGFRLQATRRQGCYELADANAGRMLGALSDRQRNVIAGALRMPSVELEEARKMREWQRRQDAKRLAA